MAQPQMRTSAVSERPVQRRPAQRTPPRRRTGSVSSPRAGPVGSSPGAARRRSACASRCSSRSSSPSSSPCSVPTGSASAARRSTRRAHAATQLLAVQDIRVAVVQADSLASRLYLTGGAEDAGAARSSTSSSSIGRRRAGAVGAGARPRGHAGAGARGRPTPTWRATPGSSSRPGRTTARASRSARRTNARRTPWPPSSSTSCAWSSRVSATRSTTSSPPRTAPVSWLALAGWVLVGRHRPRRGLAGVRFRRILNVPLALGGIAVLVVLIAGTAVQGRAISDADDAVSSSLTTADLVAQARAAAYDAAAQEALTLINRGNGAANEAKWQSSSDVVVQALDSACTNGSTDACGLSDAVERLRRRPPGRSARRTTPATGTRRWPSASASAYGRPPTRRRPRPSPCTPFAAFADDQREARARPAARRPPTPWPRPPTASALMRALVFLAGIVVVVLAVRRVRAAAAGVPMTRRAARVRSPSARWRSPRAPATPSLPAPVEAPATTTTVAPSTTAAAGGHVGMRRRRSRPPRGTTPRGPMRPAVRCPPRGRCRRDRRWPTIVADGKLRVGVSADTLLFGYRNPFTGAIEGFDIDMLTYVAQALFGGTFDEARGHDRVPGDHLRPAAAVAAERATSISSPTR